MTNITWFLRINHSFDDRIEFFRTVFVSRDVLAKAIVENPSLHITFTVWRYNRVCRKDLILMLMYSNLEAVLRPRVILTQKMRALRRGICPPGALFFGPWNLISYIYIGTPYKKAQSTENWRKREKLKLERNWNEENFVFHSIEWTYICICN